LGRSGEGVGARLGVGIHRMVATASARFVGRFTGFSLARLLTVVQHNVSPLAEFAALQSEVYPARDGLLRRGNASGTSVITPSDCTMTLTQRVESRILQTTHGRIKDLSVEEVQGRVVVRGHTASHHTRQLALHGALELLAGHRFSAEITVD
jgi:hypothetical protein